MDRRDFLTTCVAASGTAVLATAYTSPNRAVLASAAKLASAKPKGQFSKLPLSMSAPLSWFMKDKTPVDGVAEMSKWGFSAYEWLNPTGDLDALRAKADSLGMVLSCMVGAGAIKPGQMVQEEDHDRLVNDFKAKVEVAKKLKCKHLIGLTGNERTDISKEKQTENVVKCLKRLAPIAEDNDIIIVIELLNPLVDHKGFFLTRTDQAVPILNAVGSKNVKMLFDIYHQQITEGNVIRNLTENIDLIGHFHVADNPGRKEPGTGELNYTNIFKAIAKTNYVSKGHFVALECGHSTDKYQETLKATLACFA